MKLNCVRMMCLTIVALACVYQAALAAQATIGITKPTSNGNVRVILVNAPSFLVSQNIAIAATNTVEQKLDILYRALTNMLYVYKTVTNGNYGLLLSNLPPGTVIRFRSGAGETNDTIKIPKAKWSSIDFGTNDYSSTDAAGNPTVFRAGVGNDSGLVVAQVDSTSLSDLSPGNLASTLYTGLSLNPPNGVSIGLSGSVIQFTYAPGSTDTGGGRVVFGTSSGQGELEGSMAVPDQFPVFTSLSVVSRTNVIVRGANGLEGTICLVLSSTNLGLPATNWTALATNVIGSSGTFTNTFMRAPDDSRRFYRLQVPISLP